MNDGIDELHDLMQRAGATPWGKTCSALWAQAAQLAEERQEHALAVRCYGELCAAYMMGGESTRVIAPFMWLDSMFKSHPEYFTEDDVMALGWYYKYVVSTLRCVPTVPVVQCDALLDEMKQYYQQHGDSMRAYHIRCYQFYRDMGQADEAGESYARWQSAEHSELADCERCDPGYEVLYHAARGEWQLAVQAGDRALAHDGEYCDSQPEALLSTMMEPWLRVGRDAEAWAAHIRAYRRYQQHSRYFEYLQEHWTYLALSGRAGRPERLERGLTILIRHMPWWVEAEHPRLLMDSAVAAYVLLDSFTGEDTQRVLPVTLPGEGLVWAPRENVENPTIEQAREWMKALAYDVAAQFDARPGHRNAGVDTRRVAERLHPQTPPPFADAEGVVDASGLGSFRSSVHIVHTDSDNEATLASFADAARPADVEDSSQEPAPVSLVITNEWQTMTPVELLDRSWSIVQRCSTVYSLELGLRLRQNPSLASQIAAEIPDHLTEAWEWVEQSMRFATDLDAPRPEGQRESSDPAYRLIIQAVAKLDDKDFYAAGEIADQATRTPSADPIGVRLEALAILGVAAKNAGFYDEAIESVRENVNLSAMLGMEHEQVMSMWFLSVVLRSAHQYIEAIEVAHNALDILERYPQMWAQRIRLLEVIATSNVKLDYHNAAGHAHQQAGALLAEHDYSDQAAEAYSHASEAYARALDFRRSIDMRAKIVPLISQLVMSTRIEADVVDPQDADAVEMMRGRLRAAYTAMDKVLYEHALAIVMQPGRVPDEDMIVMERVMDELRVLRTSPEMDEYLEKDSAWRGAQWRSDYAYMLWNCYQYSAARDEQRATVGEFAALGDVYKEAESTLALAFMLNTHGEHSEAASLAQRVLDLLDAPHWASSPLRVNARKLRQAAQRAEGGE